MDPLALWIIGSLFVVVQALTGFLVRQLYSRLGSLEKDTASAELKAFVSRFDATEAAWEKWREGFDEMVQRRFDKHAEQLETLSTHEKRLERIERKVNGNGR